MYQDNLASLHPDWHEYWISGRTPDDAAPPGDGDMCSVAKKVEDSANSTLPVQFAVFPQNNLCKEARPSLCSRPLGNSWLMIKTDYKIL